MALNFPDSPTNGQIYTAPSGEQWIYEAATNSWTSKGLVNTTGGLRYKGDVDITAVPPTGVTSGSQYSVNPGGTANAGFGPGVTGTVTKGSMVMYTGTGWIETSHAVPDATPLVKGIDTRKWNRIGTVLSPATAGDVVNFSAGTAALPGLTPVGDPDSGLFSSGPDQVAISTGGTGRLFVDAAGRVGVGTASPTSTLTSNGTIHITGAALPSSGAGLELNYGADSASSTSVTSQDRTNGTWLDAGYRSLTHQLFTVGKERARIDSSGHILIGTSTVAPVNTPRTCIATSAVGSSLSLAQYRNSTTISADLDFVKSRSGAVGTVAAVSNADTISQVRFYGAGNASTYVEAARIAAFVDGGTVSGTSLAGRLAFSTTADGSNAPTERMRIKASGIINFSNAPVYADNVAALAGGLVAGDIYRKADGTLMITF